MDAEAAFTGVTAIPLLATVDFASPRLQLALSPWNNDARGILRAEAFEVETETTPTAAASPRTDRIRKDARIDHILSDKLCMHTRCRNILV